MQILMLLTDAFGGFGGISKFNRDFLTALDKSPLVSRVYACPRLVPEAIDGKLPESVVYERRFAAGKWTYLKHLLLDVLFGPRVDLVVCGHINLVGPAWVVSKLRGAKLALIIHGIDAWQPTKSTLANFFVKKIDMLLSVSRLSAERFSAWSGVPERAWTIIPNCVDLDVFTPGPKSPELIKRYGLEGSRVLMTLGRLASEERYKGFDEVLEVMPRIAAQFPDVKYLIVGDGKDRARLEAKARTLKIKDNVVFTGRIPESEKADHFRISDVYVMPSSGEGFGIVLIEAAACGICIIGSKVDGSIEALRHGRLGELVDPSDLEDLVSKLESILIGHRNTHLIEDVKYFDQFAMQQRVLDWLCNFKSSNDSNLERN